MSGGHFDYQQYHITEIADLIEGYIYGPQYDDDTIKELERYAETPFGEVAKDELAYIKEHKRGIPNSYGYTPETLEELKKGLAVMRRASVYAQRIDWLFSGDDGEETFHERLKEELDNLDLSAVK